MLRVILLLIWGYSALIGFLGIFSLICFRADRETVKYELTARYTALAVIIALHTLGLLWVFYPDVF